MPLIRVVWIDETLQARGVAAVLAAGRKHLSLVDCISFELMRSYGIGSVFALDRNFSEQGFTVVPR